MDRGRPDPGTIEVLADAIRTPFRPAEHECLTLGVCSEVPQHVALRAVRNGVDAMGHRRATASLGDVDLPRRAHELRGQARHLPGEDHREEQRCRSAASDGRMRRSAG